MELQTISEISSHDIAAALGISDRGVRNRASREQWTVVGLNTKGGKSNRYMFGLLPADVRQRLAMHQAESNGLSIIDKRSAPAVSTRANAPDRAKETGLAKYQLVHAFRKALEAAAWGKKKEAAEAFILAYNSQRLLPNIFNIIGEIKEPTLRALDKKLKDNNNDYTALCDGRGGWKKHGTTKYKKRKLPAEVQKAFLQCYVQPTRPSVIMAIRAARMLLEKQGVDVECDDSTFRRWLKDYETTAGHVVCLGRDGMKAYQDTFAPYVTRDGSQLRVGQCLVADGKVLNFFIRHPDTGRPVRMALIIFQDWASRCPVGWQIMPTENTIAIAAAFRQAVINLGRYPDSIYTDNGRAFKAKVFTETNPDFDEMTGLFARVGTAVQFAKPYSGRSKIVERLNLTFQDQFECLMPSFCGDSILNKPAWMHRNETFHKAWHEAKTNGYVPTIREAAHMIDKYFSWYIHQPHEGLNNRTPFEVLEPELGPGVPEEQLNYDFLWRVQKAPRRCRITLWGIEYEADFLHGLSASKKITVMYDTANLEKIYCYTPDHQYLGEALPVAALHPLAKLFGSEVSVDQVKTALKKQSTLARKTKQQLLELGASHEDTIALDSLPWKRREAIVPNTRHIEIHGDDNEPAMDTAEVKRLELVVDQAAEAMAEQEMVDRPAYFASEMERYEWCFNMKYQQRLTLKSEDEAYMAYFEATDKYLDHKDSYDDRKALYGMYGEELKQVNA